MLKVKLEAKVWFVGFTNAKDLECRGNWPMLTLKLQAKDFELTLLPYKYKSDQSLFQAEHFRPTSCLVPELVLRRIFLRAHLLSKSVSRPKKPNKGRGKKSKMKFSIEVYTQPTHLHLWQK